MRKTSITDLSRDIWEVIVKKGGLTKKDCAHLSAECRQFHRLFSPSSNYRPTLFGMARSVPNFARLLPAEESVVLQDVVDSPNNEHDDRFIALPNDRLACANSADHIVRIWDINTRQCVKMITGHQKRIKFMGILNNTFYSLSSDNVLKLWDMQSNRIRSMKLMETSEVIKLFTLLPNNRFAYVAFPDSQIHIYDYQKKEHLHTLGSEGQFWGIFS